MKTTIVMKDSLSARLSNPQRPFRLQQLVMAVILLATLLLLFLTPSQA